MDDKQFRTALVTQFDSLLDTLRKQTVLLEALIDVVERKPTHASAPAGSSSAPSAQVASFDDEGYPITPGWGMDAGGNQQWFSASRRVGSGDDAQFVWIMPEGQEREMIGGQCNACQQRIYWIQSMQKKYRYLKAVPLNEEGTVHWETCPAREEASSDEAQDAKRRAVAAARSGFTDEPSYSDDETTDVPF